MTTDRGGRGTLSRKQCLDLVATVPIGRVVYTDRALPAVMPVNFVLDEDRITIHTGSGTALAAAVRNAVVGFEVDDFDPQTMSGWFVTITGQARLVEDPAETARLARLSLRPWAHRADGRFVCIPAQHVTGTRFGPGYPPGLSQTGRHKARRVEPSGLPEAQFGRRPRT